MHVLSTLLTPFGEILCTVPLRVNKMFTNFTPLTTCRCTLMMGNYFSLNMFCFVFIWILWSLVHDYLCFCHYSRMREGFFCGFPFNGSHNYLVTGCLSKHCTWWMTSINKVHQSWARKHGDNTITVLPPPEGAIALPLTMHEHVLRHVHRPAFSHCLGRFLTPHTHTRMNTHTHTLSFLLNNETSHSLTPAYSQPCANAASCPNRVICGVFWCVKWQRPGAGSGLRHSAGSQRHFTPNSGLFHPKLWTVEP